MGRVEKTELILIVMMILLIVNMCMTAIFVFSINQILIETVFFCYLGWCVAMFAVIILCYVQQ